ncbi:uncharacterized protein B0T23DRAFT_382993 [Neurospora hispaniola]|uniref:Uncharacterized protein n=1 Tax=Neurospora hispaniola TaxID=588809 RepID=A0AAJ0I6K3_9PEZI|nr:hypothetical protein B0T23DRAFT_382993 [Neurospora hispaniola]
MDSRRWRRRRRVEREISSMKRFCFGWTSMEREIGWVNHAVYLGFVAQAGSRPQTRGYPPCSPQQEEEEEEEEARSSHQGRESECKATPPITPVDSFFFPPCVRGWLVSLSLHGKRKKSLGFFRAPNTTNNHLNGLWLWREKLIRTNIDRLAWSVR